MFASQPPELDTLSDRLHGEGRGAVVWVPPGGSWSPEPGLAE